MRILNGSWTIAVVLCAANALANDVSVTQFDLLRSADFELRADGSKQELTFLAAGNPWRLELVPNSRLASQLPAGAGADIYRGKLAGVRDSWARLSHRNGVWTGIIWDGTEHFALEIERGESSAAGEVLFYALKDTVVEPGAMSCGIDDLPIVPAADNLQSKLNALTGELRAAAAVAPTRSVDIGMLGDSSFAAEHQADPQAALVDRLNIVDGYFSDQVGVQFNVVEYRVLEGGDDPFTTDDASDLLTELRNFKFDDATLRPLGLVHLYTGRDLDGTTVGIAFTGAICSQQFGAALSEGTRGISFDTLIFAHEFGHSFGAPHDGDAGSACETTPLTFLMAPNLNGNSTFSDCSLNEIAQELASVSCLTSVASVDVLPVFSGFPTEVGNGSDFSGTVNVRNTGTSDATGVSLTIEPPAAIALDQSNLPAGCTPASAGAGCSLATIAGGSMSPSLRFDFTALGTEDAEIIATATAPDDANGDNDQRAQRIGISRTIDLAATLTGPAEISIGADGSLTIGASNATAEAATNVEIVLNTPANLAIASAEAPCTTGSGSVTCSISSLAAGIDVNFDVVLTGASAGDATIDLSVSADEADPDISNNSQQLSINVVDPTIAAVDLALAITGNAGLETGAAADYTFIVSNGSAETASDVVLAIDVPATLAATSATSGCTINGAMIDCAVGAIAGNGEAEIVVTLEGESEGSEAISATVTTSSNDTDSGNDSAVQTVDVTAPPPPPAPPASGSSSGGGAPGPFGLLALLTFVLARQRGRGRQ